MDAYIGSIMPMAFSYAPVGWMSCEGQILPISNYSALFALLGTYYGGNGVSTFGLPDLRGRAVIGQGQGPGLPIYDIGDAQGTNAVTLSSNQLPPHTHQITVHANSFSSSTNDPANAYFGGGSTQIYDSATDNTPMNLQSIIASPTGSSQPVSIQNPYVAMYYNICVEGIFPSRN
jgi:microcystin-dependent protein